MKPIASHQQYYDTAFNKLTQNDESILESEFEECEFNDCDFSSSTFAKCKFLNCTFRRCNLSLIEVPFSRFLESQFIESKLVGVIWTKAHWPPYITDPDLKFSQCILNDSSFFDLTLNDLSLLNCKLHDVDFRNANLAYSSIIHCDLSHSLFMKTNLYKADLTESYNFSINVLENNIDNAKFSRFEALSLLDSLNIELVD
ncbi:pentapeptide repeat-containing protein [Marinomonas spartinae]|uniref:pentapeptide repeat-containing protein n=1 Tax=Marinomonas spartinae TaxID=1792290 RepID=UPI0018F1BA7A|nr:pentapeptide repeat-containing protein [Marinomonas spartinae]MBJ7552694.1 pentapeptide repeat-containing protein [Marinomonas spartinae]